MIVEKVEIVEPITTVISLTAEETETLKKLVEIADEYIFAENDEDEDNFDAEDSRQVVLAKSLIKQLNK